MKQLLQLRYLIEKTRNLDGKLKYQIDRLINLKNLDPEEAKIAALKPNADAFDSDDDNSEDKEIDDEDDDIDDDIDEDIDEDIDDDMVEDEDDDNEVYRKKKGSKKSSKESKSESQVYRPPKLMSMPYLVSFF